MKHYEIYVDLKKPGLFQITSTKLQIKRWGEPCKKYDVDSHGNSMSFHVTNRRQFGPNPHQIPCHLSRFYLFSMLEHDMDFLQVQVMEFTWYLLRK